MNFTVTDHNNSDVSGMNSTVTLTERPYEGHDGVTLVSVDVKFEEPRVPEHITVRWYIPCVDIYSSFSPSSMYDRTIGPSWRKRRTSSRLASGAPVHQLISSDGRNRMTVALSDAMTPCEIATGIHEKSATVECEVRFFTSPVNTLSEYHAVIYIDFSDRRYDLSLKAADRFWQEECGYPCAYIPDTARRPLYSCWYSFHQSIDVDAIVHQCELAKAMGMESVIVDDGWQCDDKNGGYAYCGDWEAVPSKVPDMKEFVERVHGTGMKFILWYSVPAVGIHSRAYQRFRDKLLNPSAANWASLDPRFPDVREYLTGIYTDAVKNWGLDGLKLDFIDSFRLSSETPAFDERWDTLSLEEAVDRLLSEVTSALRAINPDILIEFRQSYFGPVIRKYGNMIRVGDCPNDSLRNHVAGVDLRYMLGVTAVHSDMLMWHPEDKVEAAAYQVICTLFSVPQISVLLDRIPDDHRRMLMHYLGFWNRHRDTLLDGELTAEHPEELYSLVRADKDGETVAVSFSDPLLELGDFSSAFHVNATGREMTAARFEKDGGMRRYVITDCTGKVTEEGEFLQTRGLREFRVPRSGMVEIH